VRQRFSCHRFPASCFPPFGGPSAGSRAEAGAGAGASAGESAKAGAGTGTGAEGGERPGAGAGAGAGSSAGTGALSPTFALAPAPASVLVSCTFLCICTGFCTCPCTCPDLCPCPCPCPCICTGLRSWPLPPRSLRLWSIARALYAAHFPLNDLPNRRPRPTKQVADSASAQAPLAGAARGFKHARLHGVVVGPPCPEIGTGVDDYCLGLQQGAVGRGRSLKLIHKMTTNVLVYGVLTLQ